MSTHPPSLLPLVDVDDALHPLLQRPSDVLRRVQRELHDAEQDLLRSGAPPWVTAEVEPTPAVVAGYGWPVVGALAGQPVPDLQAIRPTRWARALIVTDAAARRQARSTAGPLQQLAGELVVALDLHAPGQRWHPADPGRAVPDASGALVPGRPRSGRQLNLKLRADDHALVVEAARRLAVKPTTLARALVLEGARQVHARTQREELERWVARRRADEAAG